MSDGTTLDAGSGGDTIYTDEVSGGSANGMKVQGVKIGTGANGTWTELDATSGSLNTLDDNSAAFLAAVQAIQAAVEGTVSVDDNAGSLTVDDGGSSLTVDGTVAISGTVAVTDNSSTLSVDDGGGSLTVDGTVAATQSGTWTVGNAGTFAVQDSQVVADNAGFTDGTTKVFVTGFIYDEVAGTALTENDAAAARINVNRAQVGSIVPGATSGLSRVNEGSSGRFQFGSLATPHGIAASRNPPGVPMVE